MIIAERGMQKGMGEQRDEFKISYLEVLEPELSVEETRILNQVKKDEKGVSCQSNVW